MRPFPSGLEESHRLGEDIVVDESGEHREDSHEKNDVSTAAKGKKEEKEGRDSSQLSFLVTVPPAPSLALLISSK